MPKAVLAASSWKVALAWFYAGVEGRGSHGSLRDPVMWVTLRDIVDTCWFLHFSARISWPIPSHPWESWCSILLSPNFTGTLRSFRGFPGWQKLFWELYCSEVPTVKTGNPNETCAWRLYSILVQDWSLQFLQTPDEAKSGCLFLVSITLYHKCWGNHG